MMEPGRSSIRRHGGVTKVPITRSLLAAVSKSNQKYNKDQEVMI
jgi:hypothetical protein